MDYDKDDHIQQETDSQNPNETRDNQHPFDRLMFGASPNKKRHAEDKNPAESQAEDNLLNQVNLEEILMHIDSLVGSAKQLKPMFSKIRPLFEQFINKK